MLIVFLINALVVALAVSIHYEMLFRVSRAIPKMKMPHRRRIIVGVFTALLAHVLEIWLFAVVFFLKNRADGWGQLTGNFEGSIWDCVYFSFTTFTTLGFGDIEPFGDIRYLAGIEALTGLVLITWTASFLYFEMQRHWNHSD